MTQNVYDDPGFFAGYAALERSQRGLDGMAEWPAMRALLPGLGGKRVVDLGCGYGWFSRFARDAGATVLALDVSEKMLARAREMTAGPGIDYRRADLDALDLPPASFDLAWSALAFHYLANFDALLATVHRALVPGGTLVASVEHPLFTAPTRPGWIARDGGQAWPVDSYLVEGPRTTAWLAAGVVKQHRTTATYVRRLIEAGFVLTHLEEWGPTDAELAAHPDWAGERDRPTFMILAARR